MSAPGSQASPQVHVTVADFKRHLHHIALFVALVCAMIITFVAISMGFDVHAIRSLRTDELAELIALREGFFTRLDAQGWRMDTQAVETGKMAKTLADALVKFRAQVERNSDTSQKTATATTTIAREAVKQTAATTQLVQQVTEAPPPEKPVVNVEAKASPPVVIPVAPAPAARPLAPAPTVKAAQPRRRGPWHWLRYLWPPSWGKHAERAKE